MQLAHAQEALVSSHGLQAHLDAATATQARLERELAQAKEALAAAEAQAQELLDANTILESQMQELSAVQQAHVRKAAELETRLEQAQEANGRVEQHLAGARQVGACGSHCAMLCCTVHGALFGKHTVRINGVSGVPFAGVDISVLDTQCRQSTGSQPKLRNSTVCCEGLHCHVAPMPTPLSV